MTVNERLLKRYIRMAIDEVHLARVPQQLMPPNDEEDAEQEDEGTEENVNEFSGVGAVAGYTGPLGMDPDRLGRQKNRRKK